MAFRPPRKNPNFATLKSTLAQVKTTDNALYQVIQQIIEKLGQFQTVTNEQIADVNNSINNSITTITNQTYTTGTYVTLTDERGNLPNSRMLIAGTNIILDSTTPGQLKISVTGLEDIGGDEWSVLTNGDPVNPELIFADGDVIMGHW